MIFKIFSKNYYKNLLSFNSKHFCLKSLLLILHNYQEFCRNTHKSHYEVLNLSENSTAKDIKDSFIKLSKEYHPDKNNGKAAHKKFVEILEAYNILSKPGLRRDYDLRLARNECERSGSHRTYTRDNVSGGPWNDSTFWSNTNKSQNKYYESQPYYGIQGLKKLPNSLIAVLCFLFATFGVGLQVVVIRNSLTLRRDQMIKKSTETGKVLSELKKEADMNGNVLQIERLKERMKNNIYYVNSED